MRPAKLPKGSPPWFSSSKTWFRSMPSRKVCRLRPSIPATRTDTQRKYRDEDVDLGDSTLTYSSIHCSVTATPQHAYQQLTPVNESFAPAHVEHTRPVSTQLGSASNLTTPHPPPPRLTHETRQSTNVPSCCLSAVGVCNEVIHLMWTRGGMGNGGCMYDRGTMPLKLFILSHSDH